MSLLGFQLGNCTFIAALAIPAGVFAAAAPAMPVEAQRPDPIAWAARAEIVDSTASVQATILGVRAGTLSLVNSTQIANKAVKRFRTSPAIKAFVHHSRLSVDEKIQRLFRWVVNRPAKVGEIAGCRMMIAKAKSPHDAYRDIFWYLINTREFLVGPAK